jgi:hypothetical protein
MFCDDALHDPQPEPGAFLQFRGKERLKDSFVIVGGDTTSRIGNRPHSPPGRATLYLAWSRRSDPYVRRWDTSTSVVSRNFPTPFIWPSGFVGGPIAGPCQFLLPNHSSMRHGSANAVKHSVVVRRQQRQVLNRSRQPFFAALASNRLYQALRYRRLGNATLP